MMMMIIIMKDEDVKLGVTHADYEIFLKNRQLPVNGITRKHKIGRVFIIKTNE